MHTDREGGGRGKGALLRQSQRTGWATPSVSEERSMYIYRGATIDDWDILLALSPFLTIRNITMATTFLGNHLRVRYIFMVCLSQPGPIHELIYAGPPCGATHLPAAIHSFDDRRSLDDGLSFECSGDDFGLPPPGRYPKLAKSRIRV